MRSERCGVVRDVLGVVDPLGAASEAVEAPARAMVEAAEDLVDGEVQLDASWYSPSPSPGP